MARLTLEQVQVKADLDRAGEGDTLFGPSLPTRRRKRNRPEVYATIDDDAFANGRGVGTLDTNLDRHVVPATAIRRMACDAGIHRLVTSPLGTVIDHGRERRVVSDTQFDRLHLRDHGCRILGCGVPAAGCDAHHTVNGVGPRTARRATASFERRRRSRRPSSRRSLGAGYLILHSPDGRTLTMRPPAVGAALPAA